MLIEAVAQKLRVPASECHAVKGMIVHKNSGGSLSFGEVAELAATLKRSDKPTLKSPGDFQLIGHPVPRKDTPSKVNVTAQYGIDVELPGMLYATTKTCPVFAGKPVDYDATDRLRINQT